MSSRSSVVWQGTLVTSAVSAFGTGIHGIVTGRPNYTSLSFSAAMNGGVSAATFFSIREYAISPAMVSVFPGAQFERRRNEGQALQELTWSEIRMDRLPDSAVSGFVTGGILRGLTHGPRVALPSAFTAGAMCMLLQYMFNELKIVRLEYVSQQRKNSEALRLVTSSPTPSIQTPTAASRTNISSSVPSVESDLSTKRPWTNRLLESMGIKSLSDEEYLTKLRLQREAHLKRIAELEKVIEDEKNGTVR